MGKRYSNFIFLKVKPLPLKSKPRKGLINNVSTHSLTLKTDKTYTGLRVGPKEGSSINWKNFSLLNPESLFREMKVGWRHPSP